MNLTSVYRRLLQHDGRLYISELEVTDADLAALAPLAGEIKKLFLGQSPLITIEGIKNLAPLQDHVEHLDIWGFPLDDEGLILIVTMFPKLKGFYFGGDGVTVTIEGLKVLARLPDLKTVEVDKETYVEELQRLYPALDVQI